MPRHKVGRDYQGLIPTLETWQDWLRKVGFGWSNGVALVFLAKQWPVTGSSWDRKGTAALCTSLRFGTCAEKKWSIKGQALTYVARAYLVTICDNLMLWQPQGQVPWRLEGSHIRPGGTGSNGLPASSPAPCRLRLQTWWRQGELESCHMPDLKHNPQIMPSKLNPEMSRVVQGLAAQSLGGVNGHPLWLAPKTGGHSLRLALARQQPRFVPNITFDFLRILPAAPWKSVSSSGAVPASPRGAHGWSPCTGKMARSTGRVSRWVSPLKMMVQFYRITYTRC